MKYLFISLIFISLALNLFAQDNQKTGMISGRVIDQVNKKPLPGVTVKILGTNKGAISQSNGKFKIENIPADVYAVQFTSIGYSKFVQSDVVVSPGRPTTLEVELTVKSIQLEEAEVRASYFIKKNYVVTSTQTLSSEDIRRAPGVQEDVVRATALLPGVNVTAAGRNDLIVRGGAPFENLFIVDNIEVKNINHFGSQGSSGGPLSIINIDFVKNVEFSAGGFGSKFGDKTSSITNITLRNGNEEQFGGKVNLSATGFGASTEGPIGQSGSWFFSARRSYLDFIFNAAGFGFIPQYWDFQGKANYRINSRNRVSYLFISALNDVKLNNDNLDNIYDNSRVAVPDQQQYFTGFTWQHLFNKGFMKVTLGRTFTDFSTFQNDSNLVEIFRNNSKEGEMSLKTDFDFQLSKTSDIMFGNLIKYASKLDYDVLIPGYLRVDKSDAPPYDQSDWQGLNLDTNLTAYKNATYISYTTSLGKSRFTVGGRMDYFNFTKDNLFLSPRASYIYQINDVSAINLGLGRYYQSPSYVWLIGGTDGLNPIRADQVVLGYDHTPLEDVKVQVEVYYKQYKDYPARVYRPQAVLSPSGFDDVSSDIPFGLEPLLSVGDGESYGFEIFIQKKLSKIPLYGLFSLSISETKFTSIEGESRPSAFDSRVILNIAAGYRFNEQWEASAKFRFATGVPTTPFNPDGSRNFYQYNEGERLPNFHALDVRVDKRWYFNRYTLVTYLDIQNIYGRQNVSGIKWNYRTQTPEYNESIGVLPSIGVAFEF